MFLVVFLVVLLICFLVLLGCGKKHGNGPNSWLYKLSAAIVGVFFWVLLILFVLGGTGELLAAFWKGGSWGSSGDASTAVSPDPNCANVYVVSQ